MRIIDYFRLAYLNLKRQKIRTSLTIVSVVIGTIAILTLVSLGATAKNLILQQIKAAGSITEINAYREGESGSQVGPFSGTQLESNKEVKIDDALIKRIKKLKDVKSVVPTVNLWEIQGLQKKGKKYPLPLFGIGLESNMKLISGRFFKNNNEHSIILNNSYVRNLGYTSPKEVVGQEVTLITRPGYRGEGATTPGADALKMHQGILSRANKRSFLRAKVVGVVESGLRGNENYIPLGWARKIKIENIYYYRDNKIVAYKRDVIKEEGYNSLIIKTKNIKSIDKVANQLKKRFGLSAFSAQDVIDQLFSTLSVIQAILGLIGAVALLVATIGIVNTMVMSIYERTREIGVMRACGATKKIIGRLFIFEAGTIGFLGGILGVASTYGLRYIGNALLNNVLKNQGLNTSNIITIPFWLVIGIVAFTSALSMIASLGPALHAANLDPVEALRYE